MKTPQRIFFLTSLICLALFLFLQYWGFPAGYSLLRQDGLIPDWSGIDSNLPRYYFETGQPEKAVGELTNAASGNDPARAALNRIVALQQNPLAQTGFAVLNARAVWSSRLLVASLFLVFCFIATVIYAIFGKRPLFVIMPFANYAGLSIGSELPEVVLDRIREITWQTKNLKATSGMIAENLDIPSMGMLSDGKSLDAAALIETALLFSMGISDFPLARLVSSVRLWFEQPRYLVRGSFEKIQKRIFVSIQLIDNRKKQTVQVWNAEIADGESRHHSEIVDVVLYPLLFYFTKDVEAKRWEALHALHVGIDEFLRYIYNQELVRHLELAQEQVEKALKLEPNYGLAHYNLGLIFMMAGDYEKAREHLMDSTRLIREPEFARWGTYNYGVALFQLSQDWSNQRAVKVFEELVSTEETPEDLRVMARSSLAATYAKMAGRQRDKSEFAQKAFNTADLVLKSEGYPDASSNALAAKGYAYLAIEQLENAKSAFEEAVRINPKNITSLIGLGETNFRLKKHDDALSVLKQATILSPRGGYSHYRIGNLYRSMKDYKNAVDAYKKAPNLSMAHLAIGRIHLDDGQNLDALDEFRTATQLNSKLSEAWSSIAWAILEMDDETLLAEAETSARRAAQLEKQESLKWRRHAILSRCLLRRGKKEIALKEALTATKLGPEQPQALYSLASAQIELGRSSEGRENLRKVIDFDKKGTWRTEAEQHLLKLDKAS